MLQSGLPILVQGAGSPNPMVSSRGESVYTGAFTPGMTRVFVNGVDYSSQLHPERPARHFGITDDGRPIWLCYFATYRDLYVGTASMGASNGYDVVDYLVPQRGLGDRFTYLGTKDGRTVAVVSGDDLTTPVLGPTGIASFVGAPTAGGLVAWVGRGPSTDGYWDGFVDGANLTKPLLGDARGGSGHRYDNGRTVVVGKGSLTRGRTHVFLDGVDVTAHSLGSGAEAIAREINLHGQVLWLGSEGAGKSSVMLDERNVSKPIVGYVQVDGLHVSDSGDVLWSAAVEAMHKLYLNDRDLTTAAMGGTDAQFGGITGLNASGHAAWTGFAPSIGGSQWVFYDDFNLSRDALGSGLVSTGALAIGDGGHVLWWHLRPDPVYEWSYDIWLSTPVPEPSAIVVPLGLAALSFLKRRGKASGCAGCLRAA